MMPIRFGADRPIDTKTTVSSPAKTDALAFPFIAPDPSGLFTGWDAFVRQHLRLPEPGLEPAETAAIAELNAIHDRLQGQPDAYIPNILLASDPNRDPDDFVAVILAAQGVKSGYMKLDSIVTTLGDLPTRVRRAANINSTLQQLDVQAPVGVGQVYTALDPKHNEFHFTRDFQQRGVQTNVGSQFLYERFRNAPDKSLSIVAIAGMKDLADLLDAAPELFQQKVRDVFIMGGIKQQPNSTEPLYDAEGFVQAVAAGDKPLKQGDPAYNNDTDIESATRFYRGVQELGIPLTILNKHAAKKAAVGVDFYDGFANTGHPVGQYVSGIQKDALRHRWDEIKEPGYKGPLSTDWFFSFFTDLDPKNSEDKQVIQELLQPGTDFDAAWAHVTKLNLYDPLTVLAALPAASEMLYSPKAINSPGKPPVYLIAADEVKAPEKVKALLSGLGKTILSNSLAQMNI